MKTEWGKNKYVKRNEKAKGKKSKRLMTVNGFKIYISCFENLCLFFLNQIFVLEERKNQK